jgi:hypothetical protein
MRIRIEVEENKCRTMWHTIVNSEGKMENERVCRDFLPSEKDKRKVSDTLKMNDTFLN